MVERKDRGTYKRMAMAMKYEVLILLLLLNLRDMTVKIEYIEEKKLRNWRSIKLFDFCRWWLVHRNQSRESRDISIIWWEVN